MFLPVKFDHMYEIVKSVIGIFKNIFKNMFCKPIYSNIRENVKPLFFHHITLIVQQGFENKLYVWPKLFLGLNSLSIFQDIFIKKTLFPYN